jgi:hypothetical protein
MAAKPPPGAAGGGHRGPPPPAEVLREGGLVVDLDAGDAGGLGGAQALGEGGVVLDGDDDDDRAFLLVQVDLAFLVGHDGDGEGAVLVEAVGGEELLGHVDGVLLVVLVDGGVEDFGQVLGAGAELLHVADGDDHRGVGGDAVHGRGDVGERGVEAREREQEPCGERGGASFGHEHWGASFRGVDRAGVPLCAWE